MKGEDCLILETAFFFYCLMEAGRHEIGRASCRERV